MFKGPLRAKNEEERCCYLMLWVGEKGRKIFSTWDMTDAQQKVFSFILFWNSMCMVVVCVGEYVCVFT